MYQDLVKGLGPLGGIYTALKCISTGAGFFVACDMPRLNPALISHMAGIADDHDAVVPRVEWKLEALHAIYRRTCLPAVEGVISKHQYQIIRFFDAISIRYVDEVEIRKFDPGLRSFFNINRPEDMKKL
jgi:molybdopterin-guanine dinucleotide biosynthesis protein A